MKITREIGGYKYTTELTPAEIEMAWQFHQDELDRKYIDKYLEGNSLFYNIPDETYYAVVETVRHEMTRIHNTYSLPQEEAIILATAIATRIYVSKE